LKGRDNLEDPGTKMKIILKRVVNRMGGCGLEPFDSGLAKSLDSIKGGGILASLVTISVSRTLLNEAV